MTEQDRTEQIEAKSQPQADCPLAGISFMLALPPLTISGLVFVLPRFWAVMVLILGWVLTAGGLVTGIAALRQIADADGKLRGRGMALAGVGMASLAVIGLLVATIVLLRFMG